jgi:hypothetical protein
VSPAFAREVEDALAACDAVSAKAALLVVPNFHGAWPLEEHPAFADRLRALQAAGHEILLHGFFHEARAEVRGVRSFIAQRVASAGEAEFADLDRDEGERRMDEGFAVLEAIGLRASGFVAPAWQMARWVLPALAARGVRYAEDHFRIYDPSARRSRASLVLNFASRTPARLVSSALFVRAAHPIRGVLPTRVAIHPGDMKSAVLRGELRHALSGHARFVNRGVDFFRAHGEALA